MKRFSQIKDKGVLTIFDIDETLFHTSANIIVRGSEGQVVHKLSNQQFNTYQLQVGEYFDFSEFKSAEIFNKTSQPIDRMFARVKSIVKKKKPSSKVILLTARSDLDNKELFLDTFRKHGLPEIDDIHVHRAGNLPVSAAEGKRIYIEQYIADGNFYKVRLFDDAESNLRMLNQLAIKHPSIEFEAWRVLPSGRVRRFDSI